MLVMPTTLRSYGNALRMSVAPTLNSSLVISVLLDMVHQRLPQIPALWQLQVMTELIPPHQVTSRLKNRATRTMHMLWRSNFRRKNNVRTPRTVMRGIDELQHLKTPDKAMDRTLLTTVPRAQLIGIVLIDIRRPTRSVVQRDTAYRLDGHHSLPTGIMSHLRHMNRRLAAVFKHLSNTDTRHLCHPRHPGIIDIRELNLSTGVVHRYHHLLRDFQTGLRIGPRIVLLCRSMSLASTFPNLLRFPHLASVLTTT